MRTATATRIAFLVAASTLSTAAWGALAVTPKGAGGVTALSMANALLSASSGITINSASYTGVDNASGLFTGGTGIIGFESGVLLTSGAVHHVLGPNDDDGAGEANFSPGDAQLEDELPGSTSFDASVLTINFTPTGDQIRFSYVFASEEYNEYVGSEFNDIFAFFVGGTNYALIAGTSTPVAINNINCGYGSEPPSNCNLFVDNTAGGLNTQMDGLTKVLTFTAPVNPGVPNTIRLAIADIADPILDSAVFLAAGTLSGSSGCVPNATTACLGGGRFEVSIRWTNYQQVTSDALRASAGTSDSQIFYFTDPNNWEFLIKIIDGCSLNSRYWVYFAAATDVGYVVTVRDTGSTAPPKQYTNPLGHPSPAVNDSNAFATCP